MLKRNKLKLTNNFLAVSSNKLFSPFRREKKTKSKTNRTKKTKTVSLQNKGEQTWNLMAKTQS